MKKIKSFLTSRKVFTVLNLFIQFLIIFLILLYFSNVFVYYYLISLALGIACCIRIINKRVNSGYKIAWILFLLIFPPFGVAMYIMLDGSVFIKRAKKKMLKITYNIKDSLPSVSAVRFDSLYAKTQSDYISKYSYSPPIKNTRCKYFSGGEDYFASLLEDLKTAEKRIYIEYFIIKESRMWSEIRRILLEKAANGVDIRIIFDDVGSIDRISAKEIKNLRASGIKIYRFNPFLPVISVIMNNRDHRKIVAIDSHIAYSGGINIGDEYINEDSKFGHFKDSGIALYGEAAFSFEVFFLKIWEYVSGEKTKIKRPECDICSEGIYQPYTDSPIDDEPVGENIYRNIISHAEKYVYISTPYFVVDDEMLSTIKNSAKSGVDVRIIVPHIPDKKAVNQVTKSYYSELIEAGVKVYEYEKGFNHSKIVVADDRVATVGSVNFDYRSFFLSFECGVWMYNTPAVNDALLDFNTMMLNSIRINKQDCNANVFVRLFRAILSAIAPLL